jgi:hypothetical protein
MQVPWWLAILRMHSGCFPGLLNNLQLSRLDNSGLLAVHDLTIAVAGSLESIDNSHRRIVSDLAKDDVLAIEPAGDYGGDEELGAVAIVTVSLGWQMVEACGCLRVGTGVGHWEETRAGVLAGEVLIGELLTVDRLAASALENHEKK